MTIEPEIRDALLQLLTHAHCPYSGFPVAVIIRGSDRTLFEGVNVESAAFPSGFCAEVTALGAAVSSVGRDALEVDRVYIATRTDVPTPPCGSCRQLLSELAPDAEVRSWAVESDEVRSWTVRSLLPDAFELRDSDSD